MAILLLVFLVTVGHWLLANKSPKTPLLQEYDSNTQLLIQDNSFKGKSAIIRGTELIIWEASEKYGVRYDLIKNVINCECGLNKPHEKCWGDNSKAFGRCQFWRSTFNAYCEGDYYNETDQVNCMAKMFSEGEAHNWTCYTKLIRTLGDLK